MVWRSIERVEISTFPRHSSFNIDNTIFVQFFVFHPDVLNPQHDQSYVIRYDTIVFWWFYNLWIVLFLSKDWAPFKLHLQRPVQESPTREGPPLCP